MVEALALSAGLIQIFVQLGAVYFAYRLTRMTGAFLAWSLVIIALLLMTGRRVTALMIEMGSISGLSGSLALVDRIILPSTISILLLFAMYGLARARARRSLKDTREGKGGRLPD